jgi:hypothetical protein
MSPSLCLVRECLGVVTRIECAVRPLSGEQGLWTVLCVAGMDAMQPTLITAQGPFCGPCAAQKVLVGIADSLHAQGYRVAADVPIWCLPMQAKMRRLNARSDVLNADFHSRPDA